MKHPFSLGNTMPAVLLAVTVGLLALVAAGDAAHGRRVALDDAQRDVVRDAEQLARVAIGAGTLTPGNRDAIDATVAALATAERTSAAALVAPDGTIVAAHRIAWEGRPAVGLLPGLDAPRMSETLQRSLPLVLTSADGTTVSALLPYAAGPDAARLRDARRGMVYVAYDLAHEYDLIGHDTRVALLPQALASVAVMLLLAWMLRHGVTGPLARLQVGSTEVARDGGLARPLPERGLREVAALAKAFNEMAAQVNGARLAVDAHRARLGGIVGAAMDAIVTADARQRITMVNAAACAMFGRTEAELLGLHLDQLMPERYRAAHAAAVRHFTADRATTRRMGGASIVYGLRADGTEFPAEASISHLEIDGEALLTVILRDVTQRKAAEDRIRALNADLEAEVDRRTARLTEAQRVLEEQQLRLQGAHDEQSAILDTVTVGIALVRDRTVLRCNRRLEEILGFGPGGLDGMPTRRWFPSEQAWRSFGEAVVAALRDGGTFRRDERYVRRDGSAFWARITARGFRHGGEESVLAIIEDVTVEHEAADALQRGKELAESANRAKSAFLANMSHEIRTPMNAIIGMTYLVQKTALDAKQRDYLGKIQGSAQHLLGVINDILDFSKIEADAMRLEEVDFRLGAVLDNVRTLVAEKAAAKALELVFEVAADVPDALRGDPLRLGQVLVNYGNNAVKFTERGEIHVRVSAAQVDDKGATLRFDVRDTGIGLTQAQTAGLFQRFSQADSSTSRQFGGTGLGLAIVKRLAALMGGKVGVDSEPGRGANFWFTARFGRGSVLPAPPPGAHRLAGRRALVVDDHPSARQALAGMLGNLGVEAVALDDGAAALQAMARADEAGRPFDVVLLDWRMPGMDGFEAGARIRALPLAKPPKLALVTAFGRDDVLQRAGREAWGPVLVKPLTPSLLHDHLMQMLDPGLPAAVPGALAAPPPTAHSARVLLVEDNAINRQVVRDLLGDAGYTVEEAVDGAQALARLAAGRPDVVLMDMQMPVMDGLEATRRLRDLPALAGLPVVAMTANVTPDDRNACLAAGMDDFLPKPIDPDHLLRTVARWLRPGRAPLTSSAAPAAPVAAGLPDDVRLAPGLDAARGLAHSGGQAGLYLAPLREFVAHKGDAGAEIAAAIDAGRRERAIHLVHALRGVAGTIGATTVESVSDVLERALKAGTPVAAEAAEPLCDALDTLVGALAGALQADTAPVPLVDAVPDPGAVQSILRMLAEGDADVLAAADRHAAALRAALGSRHAEFVRRLRRYAFDDAAALLGGPTVPEPGVQR
jgi:two-component system sensor histidine kinase/response regulator